MKEIIVNETIHSTVKLTRKGEEKNEKRENGTALIVCSDEAEQKRIEKFLLEKNYTSPIDFVLHSAGVKSIPPESIFTIELHGEKVSYSFWAIRDNKKDFKFDK